MRRRDLLILSLASVLMAVTDRAQAGEPLTLYKDPACGCCTGHADYLRAHGFAVTIVETADLAAIRRRHRVPEALAGCHTIVAGDYIIEGHAPIEPIRRLLAERPAIIGISLPGMPSGSPGMGGEKTGPFTIYRIEADSGAGDPKVFAVD
jgi:hypothetical protein